MSEWNGSRHAVDDRVRRRSTGRAWYPRERPRQPCNSVYAAPTGHGRRHQRSALEAVAAPESRRRACPVSAGPGFRSAGPGAEPGAMSLIAYLIILAITGLIVGGLARL